MSVSQSVRSKRMYKFYGQQWDKRCRDCANCHCMTRGGRSKVCIAYDDNILWDENATACGLFNHPFYGLEPTHRQMARIFHDGEKEPEPNIYQEGLW